MFNLVDNTHSRHSSSMESESTPRHSSGSPNTHRTVLLRQSLLRLICCQVCWRFSGSRASVNRGPIDIGTVVVILGAASFNNTMSSCSGGSTIGDPT